MRKKYWSIDNEDYTHESLSDLIDANSELEPGCIVYVGEARYLESYHLIRSVDVVDIIAERTLDIVGEHAIDYPDVTLDARVKLDKLLNDWIAKNCPPNFYTIENVKEYKITVEDIK
jgi:hypothetical protein